MLRKSMTYKPLTYLSFILFILVSSAVNSKQSLKMDDGEFWRSASVKLSEHGNWYFVRYQINNPEKSPKASKKEQSNQDKSLYGKDAMTDVLYIRQVKGKKEYKIPRGKNPTFSDNSEWIAYSLEAEKSQKDMEKGSKSKSKKPLGQIALHHLKTGKVIRWDSNNRFRFSEDSKYFFLNTKNGLIVYNLENPNAQQHIGNIGQYLFDKASDLLIYTVDTEDKSGNGLYLLNLQTGHRRSLHTEQGAYSSLVFNEEKNALALLKTHEASEGINLKQNKVLVIKNFSSSNPEFIEYEVAKLSGFPKGMVISQRNSRNSALSWSKNSQKLFFSIQEQASKTPQVASTSNKKKQGKEKKIAGSSKMKNESSIEGATIDVWHWKDEKLQSEQMLEAEGSSPSHYQMVLDLKTKKVVQLANETIPSVQITGNQDWGVGRGKPYISDWDNTKYDFYRVNLNTGKSDLIRKAYTGRFDISPTGESAIYWHSGNYHLYNFSNNQHLNLTQKAPVSFENKEHDYATPKPGYGFSGWTKDGQAVVLQHRHDLWLQPLNGGAAKNLTQGYGDKNQIKFTREIPRRGFDPEDRFIDFSKPVILQAFGTRSKNSGYFQLKENKLSKLIYKPKAMRLVHRAENADRLLYSQASYQESNYYISDSKFSNPKKVTSTNPQASKYKWGHRILVDYQNSDGVPLQGILSIPDNYKKGQKRPMIVTSYEKQSNGLHYYPRMSVPAAGAFEMLYVSDGYLYFQPDVHLRVGTPHSDMHQSIDAAIQKVIELGYVDEKRIGYVGHSYGGHAAMYIATQKNKFAAIVGGAGVANLIQGFNVDIVRNGSSEQDYYMTGQGRLGVSPSDNLDLYLRESPIFHVKNMDTPLMLFHGTNDRIVAWDHSFGFYNLLRFNKKPVILLSYRGEGHGIEKPENKKDFQYRLKAYYDHYLKGKPAAEWITKGVSYQQKEKPKSKKEQQPKAEKPWL